jgi:hypothetical protein
MTGSVLFIVFFLFLAFLTLLLESPPEEVIEFFMSFND